MKVFEVINQENEPDLDFLYKKQAAACFLLARFLHKINPTNPIFIRDRIFSAWSTRKLAYGRTAEDFIRGLQRLDGCSLKSDEIPKLTKIYNSVLQTKTEYEEAGGDYVKKSKISENDDFESQEITVDHLFKAQKAACHQFWVYLTQLKKKYPKLLFSESWLLLLPKLSMFTLTPPANWSASLWWRWLSYEEKTKLKSKYNNIIKAKTKYEAAGGDYKEKLKESDDEFKSQEITLDHLYKAQKAACHQFWIYVMQLKKKYPKIWLPMWPLDATALGVLLRRSAHARYPAWCSPWLATHSWSSVTDQEKAKYQSRYDNVIDATAQLYKKKKQLMNL